MIASARLSAKVMSRLFGVHVDIDIDERMLFWNGSADSGMALYASV